MIRFSFLWGFVIARLIIIWLWRRVIGRVGMHRIHRVLVHGRIGHMHRRHHSMLHIWVNVVIVHILSVFVHTIVTLEHLLCMR